MVVGLTGGIGSGKSTVSAMFAELGVLVVDADGIVRELTTRPGPALEAIRARWGSELFQADGSLDRKALRALVFADAAALAQLEAILHPLVRATMTERLRSSSGYSIASVPLLFEKGFAAMCRYCVVVDVDPRRQMERARGRDRASASAIVAIMRQQYSRLQRLSKARFVVDNRADLAATRAQVVQLHRFFTRVVEGRSAL